MDQNIIIFSIIMICFCDIAYSTSELLSVIKVFRHGERTPVVFYPTDPYQDSKYWNGLAPGTLNENGKQQLYDLGKYFRKKYDSFVGEKYNEQELVVRSTNSGRNFQSAAYFLKGLFFNEDLDIPIEKARWPIMGPLVTCVKFDIEYLKQEETNEQFLDINRKNQDLYEYIRKYSEFPIFGLATAMVVWDILNVEHSAKLPLPDWTKEVFPEKLTKIVGNLSRFICHSKEQQKVGVGAFMNELIEHFEKIIEGLKEPKTIIYSGHDINIACFLSALEYYQNTNDLHVPPFASSITFELRKNGKNENFINIYYKHNPDERIPIKVPNCEFNCDFEKFKNIFQDIRLTERQWYSQCYYLDIFV